MDQSNMIAQEIETRGAHTLTAICLALSSPVLSYPMIADS